MGPQSQFVIAAALAAAGVWLMLPGAAIWLRAVGVVLASASLGLFALEIPSLGNWEKDTVFWTLACVTVASAAGAVTFKNPVYCAIWFALSLLGTGGLFLFQGAQFLAVATIVVYAGAILVTFLFVLMLAQPRGQATYDRISWEGLLSASAGAVMTGILTMTVAGAFNPEGDRPAFTAPEAEALAENVLSDRHMERLGAQLFSTHLLSVELAGTLLLVGLVGAVAITAHGKRVAEGRAPHG